MGSCVSRPDASTVAVGEPPTKEHVQAATSNSSRQDSARAIEQASGKASTAVTAKGQETPPGPVQPQPAAAADGTSGAAAVDLVALAAANEAADAAAEIDLAAAQQHVLSGQPLDTAKFGAPRPPVQSERLRTLEAIVASHGGGCIEDPDINHILNLALSVFDIDWVMLNTLDAEGTTLRGAAGAMKPFLGARFPWPMGGCSYTLTPSNHEVLVVEDLTADARFNSDAFLASTKGIRGYVERFYCSAPLVSSDNHRLGTMCVGAADPRTIDAHQVNVLCNLAELVARRLEQRWVEEIRRSGGGGDLTLRRPDAYEKPFLVVEVGQDAESSAAWQVIHANASAKDLAGFTLDQGQRLPLLDVIKPAASAAAPLAPFASAVQRGVRFSVTGSLRSATAAGSATHELWRLHFRPAARDTLDEQTPLVGVPAHVHAGAPETLSRFFAVELAPSLVHDSAYSASDGGSPTCGMAPVVIPACFEGLELGPLLGKGSYGRVYRGTFHGEEVALKIVDTDQVQMDESGNPLEAVLTSGNPHPNLVSTIAWTVTQPPLPYPGEDLESEEARILALPPEESQTWLLLEFCDKPCLEDAIARGYFGEKPGEGVATFAQRSSAPDMAAICATAHEVANGLSFLHARNVVHGDMKGGNVLLRSADNSRGFEAKIADFGLARHMGVEKRIQSNRYGTITHCPPELLLDGTFSAAVDVWAFGVMLWELYHGMRAWAGLTHPQVMHAIGIAGKQLTFKREGALPAHETYFDLAEACMARDPDARPPIRALTLVLKSAAEAWDTLKHGPGGNVAPKDLTDSECTRCVGK